VVFSGVVASMQWTAKYVLQRSRTHRSAGLIPLTRPRRRHGTGADQVGKHGQPTHDDLGASAPVELLTAWLLLLLDSGATHGYEMARQLEAQCLHVDVSYVYRTLRKLERDGYADSQWTESAIGPRRRLYRLNAVGRSKLLQSAELIAAVRDLHERFLQAHQQSIQRR